MGIVYCIAATVCFTALYIIVSRSQGVRVNPQGLTLLVFCTGLALSVANAMPFSVGMYPPPLVWTGALIGAAAGVGLLGTALSARAGIQTGVINTVASLALAVPIVLAFAFYNQRPRPFQAVGLLLSLVAIVLLNGIPLKGPISSGARLGFKERTARSGSMALIFLGNGTAQFFQARLHHLGLDALQPSALVMMYLSGTVFCAGMLVLFRGEVSLAALRFGGLVGLASYAGNFCVLRALASAPSHVVFPLVICGPIVLTVLYSRLFERIRLNASQAWGLVCGMLAVAMLSLA